MEAWQATVQDEAGNVVFNPQITVYESDGVTLASIYNEDGSPKDNPFTGTIEGFAQFWADPGVYKVRGANGGLTELWEVDLGSAKLPPYYGGPWLDSEGAAWADTTLTMTAGSPASVDQGDIVQTRLDGESYVVRSAAQTDHHVLTAGGVKLRKPGGPKWGTVLIYGSSTMAGAYAGGVDAYRAPEADNHWTPVQGSWAARLTEKLGADAYVINRSRGGRSLATLIDNFWTEVAVYRPRFVVGLSGWNNQPGGTAQEKASRYISHAAQVKALCDSIGAQLIVAAFNPINTLDLDMRLAQNEVKIALASMGVRIWDLSAGTAADDYTILSGLNADTIHLNADGHAAASEAIMLGDFGAAHAPIRRRNNYVLRQTASDDVAAMFVALHGDVRPMSWSVGFRARNNGMANAAVRVALLRFTSDAGEDSGSDINVRYIGNELRIYLGTTTVLLASGMDIRGDMREHSHLITYRHTDRRLSWYIDGVLIGHTVLAGTDVYRLHSVAFGGGLFVAVPAAANVEFGDIQIWGRNILDDGTAAAIARGDYIGAGLIVDADLTYPFVAAIPNKAGSLAQILRRPNSGSIVPRYRGSNANGEWFIDPNSGLMTCTHRMSLGSRIFAGAGTMASPYRTNTTNWVFPRTFSAPPSGSVVGNLDSLLTVPSLMSAAFKESTMSQFTSVQAVMLSSDSTDLEVTAVMVATGPA